MNFIDFIIEKQQEINRLLRFVANYKLSKGEKNGVNQDIKDLKKEIQCARQQMNVYQEQ